MSMEVVAPEKTARAIRERLMNPPGGVDSSELEVIPPYFARALRAEEYARRTGAVRKARRDHAKKLLQEFAAELDGWVLAGGDLPAPPPVPHVTVAQIIDAASEHYEVPVIHILSARRKAEFVRPRRMVMYLAREHTACSLPMIGARLGGRDHTTCISGYAAIAELVREGDQKTLDDLSVLRAMLEIGQ